MPMPWNLLRTDNFAGDPNSGYVAGYAPIGYTNAGGLQAAMQGGILCSWNNWTSSMVQPTVTANVGGGGKVKGQVNTLVGNLPGLGWGVETGGNVANTQFVATNAAGTTGFICSAVFQAGVTQPSVRLAIRSLNGSRTLVSGLIAPSITTIVGCWLESGYANMPGGTEQWVFCKLYAPDGVTLLGEVNQLFFNDWASCPGSLSADRNFALSAQWGSWDNVSYWDYAFIGALQAPEAKLFSCSQKRAIVYCVPPQGGTAPYTYQWQRRQGISPFANIVGATNPILYNDIVSGTWEYRCIVTDAAAATATSNVVIASTATMVTIIANGDSITEGLAGGLYASWQDALQDEFTANGKQCFVINFAAGATLVNYQAGLSGPYTTWNNRVKPDVVTARMATNNAFAGTAPATVQAELALGVQAATLAAVPLVKCLYLCEPWSGTGEAPRNANNILYDAVFAALAAANPADVKWQGNGPRGATTIPPALPSWFNEAAPNELHPTYLGNRSGLTVADYPFIIANLDPVTITSVTFDQADPANVLPLSVTPFSATVAGTGLFDPTVTFSVQSGAGSINPTTGVFTAAGAAGVTVIRATSNGNPAIFDDLTINVGSPGGISGLISSVIAQ